MLKRFHSSGRTSETVASFSSSFFTLSLLQKQRKQHSPILETVHPGVNDFRSADEM